MGWPLLHRMRLRKPTSHFGGKSRKSAEVAHTQRTGSSTECPFDQNPLKVKQLVSAKFGSR